MRPKQARIEGESYPSAVHGQTPRNFKTKKKNRVLNMPSLRRFFFVCKCVGEIKDYRFNTLMKDLTIINDHSISICVYTQRADIISMRHIIIMFIIVIVQHRLHSNCYSR